MQIEIPLKGALSERDHPGAPQRVHGGDRHAARQHEPRRAPAEPQSARASSRPRTSATELRRSYLASMPNGEEIPRARSSWPTSPSLEPELAKIGLVLINVGPRTSPTTRATSRPSAGRPPRSVFPQAEIDVAEQQTQDTPHPCAEAEERAVVASPRPRRSDPSARRPPSATAIDDADLEKGRVASRNRAQGMRPRSCIEVIGPQRRRRAPALEVVTGENEAKARIADRLRHCASTTPVAIQRSANGLPRGRGDRQGGAIHRPFDWEAGRGPPEEIEAESSCAKVGEGSAKAAKAQTIVDAEAEAEKTRIRAQGGLRDLRQARGRRRASTRSSPRRVRVCARSSPTAAALTQPSAAHARAHRPPLGGRGP